MCDGRRIQECLGTLVGKQDPTLLESVGEQARQKACETLHIACHQRDLESIEKQEKEMERREHRLRGEQRSTISGTTVDDELERGGYYSRYDHEVENPVKARAKALEANILAEPDLGK